MRRRRKPKTKKNAENSGHGGLRGRPRKWKPSPPAKTVRRRKKTRKKKKVRRRRTTPSPDVRRGGRKHRKGPDTSGDEERMPKVTRQDRKTFLIQMR